MSIEFMREEIALEYPSETWQNKVKDMPTKQVVAIYHSIMNRKQKEPHKKQLNKEPENGYWRQASIFDFMTN